MRMHTAQKAVRRDRRSQSDSIPRAVFSKTGRAEKVMPKFPWLTTDSLLSAWEHVEENAGCAGADGITIDHFGSSLDDKISALLRKVETDESRALPLLSIVVQKKPNSVETRTLMVPAVGDRVLQTM